MRKQQDRVGVILFWLLLICTFLISAFRKQQSTSAPASNHTGTNPATQKPQSSQPSATAHPEPVVDSGMIEVALVVATVGFLLYQFGDELNVPQEFSYLTMKQIGKFVVFVGITAAFLLHASLLEVWVRHFNRSTGRLNSVAIPVLIGHTIIFTVLVAAMAMSASFAVGDNGIWLAILAMATLIPNLFSRRS